MTRYIYWSFIYKITLCVLFYSTSTPIQFFFLHFEWVNGRSLTLTSHTLLFMYKPNGKFYIYAKKRKESLCRYIVFLCWSSRWPVFSLHAEKKINKKISFLFSNFHFFFCLFDNVFLCPHIHILSFYRNRPQISCLRGNFTSNRFECWKRRRLCSEIL